MAIIKNLTENKFFIKETKLNKNFEVNLSKLDDSQRAAVTSNAQEVITSAPAGSGKTSVIISAIANYRYEHIIDRICAITYTRAARAEMQQRLENMGIYDVEVTTIHVWCRNLLEKMADKHNFTIRILTEEQIRLILAQLIENYQYKRPKWRIKLDILYSFIMGNKLMEVSDYYKQVLMYLERQYITYKRDNVLYDFTDYPRYLYDIMTYYNEEIHDIDALFVDEFQDVDNIQIELFNLVKGAHKKFFVGDSWQSIYVFRGADGSAFDKFQDYKHFALKCNYRSYQPIIDYATTVYKVIGYCNSYINLDYDNEKNKKLIDKINHWFEPAITIHDVVETFPSDIYCARGTGKNDCFIEVVKEDNNAYILTEEYNNVNSIHSFEQLKDDIYNLISLPNTQVLCRTNKVVNAISAYGYINASTVHQAKGLEYDNVIVVDFEIKCKEDLNIAYVALTRARNKLLVINWVQLDTILREKAKKRSLI